MADGRANFRMIHSMSAQSMEELMGRSLQSVHARRKDRSYESTPCTVGRHHPFVKSVLSIVLESQKLSNSNLKRLRERAEREMEQQKQEEEDWEKARSQSLPVAIFAVDHSDHGANDRAEAKEEGEKQARVEETAQAAAKEMAQQSHTLLRVSTSKDGEFFADRGEEEIVDNCSLMEYETTMTGARDEHHALLLLQKLSDDFYAMIGGAISVAAYDTKVTPTGEIGCFSVVVKWALPVRKFEEKTDVEPSEVAQWLLTEVPPNKPDAMNARQGVFMDVDLSILRHLLVKALERYPPAKKASQ